MKKLSDLGDQKRAWVYTETEKHVGWIVATCERRNRLIREARVVKLIRVPGSFPYYDIINVTS
jgi:hypothetical protein